jgi:hypothetical protein
VRALPESNLESLDSIVFSCMEGREITPLKFKADFSVKYQKKRQF